LHDAVAAATGFAIELLLALDSQDVAVRFDVKVVSAHPRRLDASMRTTALSSSSNTSAAMKAQPPNCSGPLFSAERRLRSLGLIKKVTQTYRYYLTRLGRAAIAAACSLTRFSIVTAMAAAH
jgi:hypothetical protein